MRDRMPVVSPNPSNDPGCRVISAVYMIYVLEEGPVRPNRNLAGLIVAS
jgi:hypothetical protein